MSSLSTVDIFGIPYVASNLPEAGATWVQLAKEMCPVLPVGFEDDISAVFCHMFTDAEALADDLERILGALKDIL